MATTTKVTKREMFVKIREVVVDNADMVAFIDHEIELLDNKKKADKKPTQAQVENEKFRTQILDFLGEIGAPVTIKDIINGIEVFKERDFSNQKVNRLLITLREDGKVKRTYKKKVAYFELGNEHEDTEVAEAEEV